MKLDDSSIYITRWGVKGPRVVLVHGGAQGGRIGGDRQFEAQQQLAERGWQVIVPDRPGHGRSAAPGRPDDAEADGAWVADLLEGGAHLVGHSFGGCVALAAAASRPAAVRSLTFIEPGMQGLAVDDPQVRRFILRLVFARLFSLSAASRARRFLTIAGIPPELRGTPDRAELERIGRGLGRIRIPSKAMLEHQLNQIKRARIPLLIVTGGWSPAIDATAARVAALGDGRHVVVPSPHHFPHLVGLKFNEILGTFMSQSDVAALRPGAF